MLLAVISWFQNLQLHIRLGPLHPGHLNERQALASAIEENYPRWWQLLQSEFSLLLYGFGSKKAQMEDFAKKMLKDGGVVTPGC